MIFVTTGHQTPFDRLIRLVDSWSADHDEFECFAQIGSGAFIPAYMKWCRWLSPEQHQAAMERASVIVGHAGTGTILQAMELGKPILVLARKSSLAETRNDHQIATVRELTRIGKIEGAVEDEEFLELLDTHQRLSGSRRVARYASGQLIDRIRSFIDRC